MKKGRTKNRYSSIRSVPISEWTSARTAIDNDVFARLLFQFGDFFHHMSSDDGSFCSREL